MVPIIFSLGLALSAQEACCERDDSLAEARASKTEGTCCEEPDTSPSQTNKSEGFASSPPVVCTLGNDQFQARRAELATFLQERIESSREIERGYELEFDEGNIDAIVEFIQFERECCRFLAFTLEFKMDKGPITLRIEGPKGTKAFLAEMLSLRTE